LENRPVAKSRSISSTPIPAPVLADPKSSTPLRESRFQKVKPIGKVLYFGYGFENDWELVPGTWTFEIWFQGRKLAVEQFTVVK
jgi:hypothetical protein